VEAKNLFGSTPLDVAALEGCIDVVKLLIAHGARPGAKDEAGWTPLHMVAWCGSEPLSKRPYTAPPRRDESSGATELLSGPPTPDGNGEPSRSNRRSIARYLIEKGAKVDARGPGGWTPLHVAASFGDLDIVKILIEHGANPAVRTNDGMTALDLARKRGYVDVVGLLYRR
jgi:ankyrin repeat protein